MQRKSTWTHILLAFAFAARICAQEHSEPGQPLSAWQAVPATPIHALEDGIDVPQQATLTELEQLRQRMAAIEQTVNKAEAKEEQNSWSPSSEPNAVTNEDLNSWKVKLGGHVQLDYVNWARASGSIPNTQDFFEFRRLRLVADGTGYGQYDFRLQTTLEPETVGESPAGTVVSPDIKDAYLSMNDIPMLGRLRIGNFFVPFSLEQVTNDTNNIFLERSIPTQGVFSPDREVGIAFYDCTEDERLTLSCGVFFDSISEGIKERIDDNQGCRLSGRATWLPYYDTATAGRYLIHVGVGVLHTEDQDSNLRFRTRPHIHEGPRIIDTGAIAADSLTTGNLEFAVVWANLSIQSEAFISGVDRIGSQNSTLGGWYVYSSYFLTGENRVFEPFGQHGAQFGRNKPNTNFFLKPGCAGWGAWEAKLRYSNLTFEDLDRGQYNDFTCGLNWYWNDRTRVMFDWIHPVTSDAAVFGETTSDLLAMRFDFNW